MGTRATYQFPNDVTIYKHWDGYPQGAAVWLYKAFVESQKAVGDLGNQRGPAESMIVANPDCEITKSHELHGDTEYRYNIDQDWNVTCLAHNGDFWEPEFNGSIVEFIDTYEDGAIQDLGYGKRQKIVKVNLEYRSLWMTEDAIKYRIDEKCKLLGVWAAHGHSMSNANAESCKKEIENLKLALKQES